MKGLIVAAHANMAEELLHACELIIGPLPRSRAISVRREDNIDDIRKLFSTSIDEVGIDGAQILIDQFIAAAEDKWKMQNGFVDTFISSGTRIGWIERFTK